MTPSTAVDPAKPGVKDRTAWFYRNLLLLIAFGVLFCAWLLHYSDWFETVGGLLALGGAFSWLAFVSRALPEDAVKQMQQKSAELLQGKSATRAILIIATALVSIASFVGSVSVEPGQEGFGHYLYIYPQDGKPDEPLGLSSTQPTRFVRPAFPIFGWSRRIKVPGLASKLISFHPWWLSTIYIPHSFDRRVYLVRPNADASFAFKNNLATIRLSITGSVNRMIEITRYGGHSFWLNCAPDVIIPPPAQVEILNAIPADKAETLKQLWLVPRRPVGLYWDDLDLREGDKIEIEEVVPAGQEPNFRKAELTVHQSRSYGDAVEILVLEKP
jgi:hypothetical protein